MTPINGKVTTFTNGSLVATRSQALTGTSNPETPVVGSASSPRVAKVAEVDFRIDAVRKLSSRTRLGASEPAKNAVGEDSKAETVSLGAARARWRTVNSSSSSDAASRAIAYEDLARAVKSEFASSEAARQRAAADGALDLVGAEENKSRPEAAQKICELANRLSGNNPGEFPIIKMVEALANKGDSKYTLLGSRSDRIWQVATDCQGEGAVDLSALESSDPELDSALSTYQLANYKKDTKLNQQQEKSASEFIEKLRRARQELLTFLVSKGVREWNGGPLDDKAITSIHKALVRVGANPARAEMLTGVIGELEAQIDALRGSEKEAASSDTKKGDSVTIDVKDPHRRYWWERGLSSLDEVPYVKKTIAAVGSAVKSDIGRLKTSRVEVSRPEAVTKELRERMLQDLSGGKPTPKDEDIAEASPFKAIGRIERAEFVYESDEGDVRTKTAVLEAEYRTAQSKLTEKQAVYANRAVRAAILSELGAKSFYSFSPIDSRDNIFKRLEAWGFPTKVYGPIVDFHLVQDFSVELVDKWAKEDAATRPVAESKAAVSSEPKPVGPSDSKSAPTTDLDALIESLDNLLLSTRVRYSIGSGAAARAESTPDAKGGVTFGGRAQATSQFGIEVGRGSDAYELCLRHEWAGAIAPLGSYSWMFSEVPHLGARVAAQVPFSAGGAWTSGIVLRFPNTAAGLEAMKQTLRSIVEQPESASTKIPALATIGLLDEKRGTLSLGAAGRGSLQYRGLPEVEGQRATPGVGAGISAGVGGQRIEQTISGGKGVVTRSWAEAAASVSATASAVAPLRNSSVTLSLAEGEASLTLESSTRYRLKVVRDHRGLVLPGTEKEFSIDFQTRDRLGAAKSAVPEFGEYVNEMEARAKASPPDENAARRLEALQSILNSVGNNEQFGIVIALDPRVMTIINNNLKRAEALEAAGQSSGTLRADAEAMLNDDSNYVLHRTRILNQYFQEDQAGWGFPAMRFNTKVATKTGIAPTIDWRPTPEEAQASWAGRHRAKESTAAASPASEVELAPLAPPPEVTPVPAEVPAEVPPTGPHIVLDIRA